MCPHALTYICVGGREEGRGGGGGGDDYVHEVLWVCTPRFT